MYANAQYFIPAAKKGINEQIELAILRADRMGVKVLSLAALNKVSCFTKDLVRFSYFFRLLSRIIYLFIYSCHQEYIF
jgi:hypothetical protein